MRTRSLEDMTWEATMICLKEILRSDERLQNYIKQGMALDKSTHEVIAVEIVAMGRAIAEESIKNEVVNK